MQESEIDEVEKAVTFMRMGGKNRATGRQWSREAFIHYAIQRAIGEIKVGAGKAWPEGKK